jgi:hypothetical protein
MKNVALPLAMMLAVTRAVYAERDFDDNDAVTLDDSVDCTKHTHASSDRVELARRRIEFLATSPPPPWSERSTSIDGPLAIVIAWIRCAR